MQEKKIYQGTI